MGQGSRTSPEGTPVVYTVFGCKAPNKYLNTQCPQTKWVRWKKPLSAAMPWELEHDDMDLPMPAAFTPPPAGRLRPLGCLTSMRLPPYGCAH